MPKRRTASDLPKRPTVRSIVRAVGLFPAPDFTLPSDTAAMEAFVAAHFAGRKTVTKREGLEIMALLIQAIYRGHFDGPEPKVFVKKKSSGAWMRPKMPAKETLTDSECRALLDEALVGLTDNDKALFDYEFEVFRTNCWRNDDDTVNLEVFEIWIDEQFDFWHARDNGFDGPVVEAPAVEAEVEVEAPTVVEVEYTFDADDEPELIAAFLPDLRGLSMPTIRKETRAALNLLRSYYSDYARLTRRHLACLATQGDAHAFEWLASGRPSGRYPVAAA